MSVKFEKETIRDAPVPGGRKHEIAHEIGERLTGGDTVQGYLAVREPLPRPQKDIRTNGYTMSIGLPPAAPEEPSPHKDAHIWHTFSSTRSDRILDRERCQQAWPLRQLSSAQDGCLRRVH